MPQDIHLLRGSPAVRPWSKYQSTVPDWTLCGIHRKPDPRRQKQLAETATENADEVTCRYCRMLMRASAKIQTATAPRPQERKATAG